MWTLAIQNESKVDVAAPSPSVGFVEGQSAVVMVEGLGSVVLLDQGHQPGGPHYSAVDITSGKGASQRWWYDGNGSGTLTIDGAGGWQLSTDNGTALAGVIGGPVPTLLTDVPPNTTLFVTASTNASYAQRVSFTVGDGPPSGVWQGSGEMNAPLVSNAVFVTPPDKSIRCGVTFEYSSGGTWSSGIMSQEGRLVSQLFYMRVVSAEDGTDQDFNDSVILVQWWAPPGR